MSKIRIAGLLVALATIASIHLIFNSQTNKSQIDESLENTADKLSENSAATEVEIISEECNALIGQVCTSIELQDNNFEISENNTPLMSIERKGDTTFYNPIRSDSKVTITNDLDVTDDLSINGYIKLRGNLEFDGNKSGNNSGYIYIPDDGATLTFRNRDDTTFPINVFSYRPDGVNLNYERMGINLTTRDYLQSELVVQGTEDGNPDIELITGSGDQSWDLAAVEITNSFTLYDKTYSKNPITVERNTPSATFYIDSTGNIGIGTTSPLEALHVDSDAILISTAQTPASAGETCTKGTIAWDTDYIYVCVATDTWKRSAITTW